MARALVTGGAGFLGSWLCENLAGKRLEVICADNLLTGKEENISHLKSSAGFSFIQIDVTGKQETLKLPETDYIFHLASPASPKAYRKHSIETLLVNSIGTLNMLELARKNNSRFLLTSTSEVYGTPLEHPQKETYWGNVNPVGERSCYDEGKRFAEALTMEYFRKHKIDVRIARIFNTYGPRLDRDDGRVISNFITQALAGEKITIYGKGEQTRSFCYASDMAEGLAKLMFTEDIAGEIINLGNPKEFMVKDAATLIKSLANSSSEIIFQELPKDDPDRRKPDISKAQSLLHWQPEIVLEEGLRSTIEWYRNYK